MHVDERGKRRAGFRERVRRGHGVRRFLVRGRPLENAATGTIVFPPPLLRLRDALVAAVAAAPVAELPGLARTLGLHRFDADVTLAIDPVKIREITADTRPKIAERKVDDVLHLVDYVESLAVAKGAAEP